MELLLPHPYVSGIIALMLSVNPCLDPSDIESIIKLTADDVNNIVNSNPNNTPNVNNNNVYSTTSGAGRINAYEAVNMAQNFGNSSKTFIIGENSPENIVWTDIKNADLVEIRPGSQLTLENTTLRMVNDGQIIVQRGAKLIIDNSTITNACVNGTWYGIEVWGNLDEPNNSHDGITPVMLKATGPNSYPQDVAPEKDHGVVVLTNGAILENAYNAITTQRKGGSYPTYYGGIVYAEDSEFLNNGRCVEFMQFDFDDNASQFVNCTFRVDKELNDPDNYQFVTIWDVTWKSSDSEGNEKFTFENCLFESSFNPLEVLQGNSITGKALWGILAIDSEFSVESSRFISMEQGILAHSTTGDFPSVRVIGENDPTEPDFEDLFMGIFVGGALSTEVENCYFKGLDTNDPNNPYISQGIYVQGGESYNIYENSFVEHHGSIYSYATEDIPTNVWGNDIRDGNFAITAINQNNGMMITCNDMDRMLYDLSILNNGVFGSINSVQGGAGHPTNNNINPTIAGNLFTDIFGFWLYFSRYPC